MSTTELDLFQKQVSDLLLRHKSFLDLLSKFQESNAKVNRALTKTVTECGCLTVDAKKQIISSRASSLIEMKNELGTHLSGELCEHCREIIEIEMGKHLFYMAALCNQLNLPLKRVLEVEKNKLSTLGHFNLT